MENKEVKITVQLTEKDYLKFQQEHSGFFKSKIWWVYSILILIMVSFSMIADGLGKGFAGIDFTSLIPLLVLGVIITVSVFTIKAKVKSAFKSDEAIQHPMEISFNEQGMSIVAYRATQNPLWESIYRYSITQDTIYIYTAENKSVLIPIRAFENEQNLDTVVGILKSKVDLSKYEKQASKLKRRIWLLPILIISGCLLYAIFGNAGLAKKESRALQFENSNNFESALVVYNELVDAEPDNTHYILSRANCEIYLSKYELAIADCERAIKLDPANGRAYYYYAEALYYNEQYDKACEAIRKSVSIGYTNSTEDFCE